MKEPTREQTKEAFNKTIERWEKIMEDVDYFNESECTLCLLESIDGEIYVCSQSCPIRLHTEESSCHGTPYGDFFKVRTPENALAELNFLRKVYIWWMEGDDKDKKEKKKEEWVDVTKEIKWKAIYGGSKCYLMGYYEKTEVAYWYASEGIRDNKISGFKLEIDLNNFRILKKT